MLKNRRIPHPDLVRSIIGSFVISIILFILLVSYAPDAVSFSPNNYGWNGLHDVFSEYDIHLSSTGVVLPQQQGTNRSVLLVIQPILQFSQSDALNVKNFVGQGGTLVIADNLGTSNYLLDQMGLGIRILTNLTVNDPVYNWKAPSLPTAIVPHLTSNQYGFLAGVVGIAMDEPSPLTIIRGSSALVVASSSPESFDANRTELLGSPNLLQILNGAASVALKPIAKGPLPLAALQTIGKGTVIVVGDSQFFTNPIWKIANNQILIGNLFSNSTVYLDSSHWQVNTEGVLRTEIASIFAVISRFPLDYLLTLGFAGAALLLLPVYTGAIGAGKRRKRSVKSFEASSSSETSSFNKDILARVRKDREKYGIR